MSGWRLLVLLFVLGGPGAFAGDLWAEISPKLKPEVPTALFSSDERRDFKRALYDARRGRLADAFQHVRTHDRPVAKDMLRWVALRHRGAAPFEVYRLWLETNPDWPSHSLILQRAEAAVRPGQPAEERLAWFDTHPPVTGTGRLAYARALFAGRRHREGVAWLKRGWMTAPLSSADQRWWLARFGEHLTAEDHFHRADYFLWQRNRTQAHRLLPLLSADQQALIKARSALIAFAYNVDGAIARVPDALQDDPGLVFDRVYWRRIKGKNQSSRALMLNTPVDGSRIHNPSNWWQERHYQARKVLADGDAETAYRLAAEHALTDGTALDELRLEVLAEEEAAGLPSVPGQEDPADLPRRLRAQIAEAEWLAGWIALRFLDRPDAALDHFLRMHRVVGFPISISRAAYWAGRAEEAAGDPMAAIAWYREAAKYDLYYYGQLARDRLGEPADLVRPAMPPRDSFKAAAFRSDPRVLAARYLADLDNDRELKILLSHLILEADDPARRALALDLAEELSRPDAAVSAAKVATRDGDILLEAGYPVIALPRAEQARLQPLVLGVARQESLFFPGAKSRAGALGLMQLTPATARLTARQVGLPYNREWLTSDAQYNLQLGSAHLSHLLTRYDGSFVLALAAYNAGPYAAERWVRDYGDPRNPAVDIVDWVELIPFGETRNYVQRVLDATAVYALILDSSGTPASLIDLLNTGRPTARSVALGRPTLAN